MKWTAPLHSKSAVDKAANALVRNSGDSVPDAAWNVVANWREAHEYPLQVLHKDLLARLEGFDPKPFTAHRLKTMPSITSKLASRSTKLSQMQDVGGLRVVLSEIQQVRELVQSYTADTRFVERVPKVDDYIDAPKSSGYRGVHLIFKYKEPEASPWNGLQIELQVRTALQHCWAMAVETAGTLLGQKLKSGQGSPEWLNLFTLVGAAMALREDLPVPQEVADLSSRELHQKIRELANRLLAVEILNTGEILANWVNAKSSAEFFLLHLDSHARQVSITSFGGTKFEEAARTYSESEKREFSAGIPTTLLVSTGQVQELLRAYPSYFLDAKQFLTFLQAVVLD